MTERSTFAGLIFLLFICSLAGLVIFAKYHTCDPLQAKRIVANDQLLPLFVMDTLGSVQRTWIKLVDRSSKHHLQFQNRSPFTSNRFQWSCRLSIKSPVILTRYGLREYKYWTTHFSCRNFPGFPGLFVSGIFSGALSTVSSGVNSLATVTLEDIIKGYSKRELSDKTATWITKGLGAWNRLIFRSSNGVSRGYIYQPKPTVVPILDGLRIFPENSVFRKMVETG